MHWEAFCTEHKMVFPCAHMSKGFPSHLNPFSVLAAGHRPSYFIVINIWFILVVHVFSKFDLPGTLVLSRTSLCLVRVDIKFQIWVFPQLKLSLNAIRKCFLVSGSDKPVPLYSFILVGPNSMLVS